MMEERFHLPSGEEINDLLSKKDAENTKKSTSLSVKCLKDFIEATDLHVNIDECSREEIERCFEKNFCVGARKTNGERFKKTALQNIRYGLKRYLKEKSGIDIISDPDFHGSNEVFKAVSTDLKRRGLGNIVHHPPISENDLKKLYSGNTPVFDTATPYGLQKKVWFEIMLYLCRRGRENIRSMTKDTFRIGKDDTGRQYVYQFIDELDKNHRADTGGSVTEGRMYEIPVSETPLLQDLGDLSDVFREDFELEPLDVTRSCTTDLQTILCEVDQNQVNTQNQVDTSFTRFLNFRPNFSDNCNVTININFQK